MGWTFIVIGGLLFLIALGQFVYGIAVGTLHTWWAYLGVIPVGLAMAIYGQMMRRQKAPPTLGGRSN